MTPRRSHLIPGGLSTTSGGSVNSNAFGHVYFLITKAKRTISPTTTTITKDFNVNYAMLPQGSRQCDTHAGKFAFTYCLPFPMGSAYLSLSLSHTDNSPVMWQVSSSCKESEKRSVESRQKVKMPAELAADAAAASCGQRARFTAVSNCQPRSNT